MNQGPWAQTPTPIDSSEGESTNEIILLLLKSDAHNCFGIATWCLVALEMRGNWARLSLLSLTMFENVFADRQVASGGDEALGLSFSDEECQEMLAEWVLTSIETLFFSHFVDDSQTRRLARAAYPVKNGIFRGSGVHKTQQVCVHTALRYSQTASPKWRSILFQFLATCYVWLCLGMYA